MSKNELKPFGLKKDENGNLYTPLIFASYSDLARIKTGLIQSLKLLSTVIWQSQDDETVRDIFPNAFDSITEIVNQLNEIEQQNVGILDKLHEQSSLISLTPQN
jgi:hypothetical protein